MRNIDRESYRRKHDNYSKATMKLYQKGLKFLISRKADLYKPDTVKEILAQLKVSESRKHTISCAYTLFLKMQGLTWKPPKFHIAQKIPFIPTEREIDDLIAGCGKKTATFLQMLKETAMRAGEASAIKWENIDLERKIVTLNEPEKHGRPRIFNISDKLAKMLSTLKGRNEYVWGTNSKVTRGSGLL